MAKYDEDCDIGEAWEFGEQTVTEEGAVGVVDRYPRVDSPRVGHVESKPTACNQRDEPVLSWIGFGPIQRDPTE